MNKVWIAAVAAIAAAALFAATRGGDSQDASVVAGEEAPVTLAANEQDRGDGTGGADGTGGGGQASIYSGSYELQDPDTGTNVSVTVADGVRSISANGIPNHETGDFPNEGNPNTISAQSYQLELPTDPEVGEPTYYNVPQKFGIAYDGVLIDPFAAEWYQNDPSSGWQLAALASPLGFDDYDAHVQPDGTYHYHGPASVPESDSDTPELIGWAADGFPIYGPEGYSDPNDPDSGLEELTSSWQLKSGERPDGPGGTYDGTYVEDYEYVEGSGSLDECNGRYGVTAEYPDGTYYYVATEDWPYYGRCLVGEVSDGWQTGDGPGAPGSRAGPRRAFRVRAPRARSRTGSPAHPAPTVSPPRACPARAALRRPARGSKEPQAGRRARRDAPGSRRGRRCARGPAEEAPVRARTSARGGSRPTPPSRRRARRWARRATRSASARRGSRR